MPFRPINAADTCILRSRRLLDLANTKLPVKIGKNDLRRFALVMAVTAIDSYMHRLVYDRLSEVRTNGDLPKLLAQLDMPFADIASLANAAIEARRDGRIIRPWVQVKNAMQKRLLRETFQSYEQVGRAFAFAGVKNPWKRIADELGAKTQAVKMKLDHLVNRRNQIVHEGDIKRMSRPRKLKYNSVTHDEIARDVDWIEKLVAAFENVAT